MKRDNHYEAAFEAYLRRERLAYIAVDEARRSLVPDGSLKSLDFIVSPPGGPAWLVDVKNWSTRDDLRSLAAWQRHFGAGFTPLLVFAYHLVGSRSPLPPEQLFEFRGAHYGFVAVRLADFVPHARPLSDSWDTVAMPVGEFRRAARSLDDLLQTPVETATAPALAASDWQPLPSCLEWQ
jgi:hypothetical protein